MKFKKTYTLISLLFIFSFCLLKASLAQNDTGIQTMACSNLNGIAISTVYSPYSIHLIKSELSGTILKINKKEGEILRAGTPVFELDCESSKRELKRLENILSDLKKTNNLQKMNLQLIKKKYERYQRLFQKGHIQRQTLEDIEVNLNSALISLTNNDRQQEETLRAIITLREKLKKCAPVFHKDLYVAENFKEIYDTVVPGETVSKLFDISLAKVHLVLPLNCFKKIKDKLLKHKNTLNITITTESGEKFSINAKVEKLKIDTDNDYLYSYGFDLVFKPIDGLLFGEVVNVHLSI